MNFAQRKLYFTSLWPRACGAQDWDERSDDKRHQVTRQCMLLCGGPDTDSTTTLGEAEISALFTYLRHLGAPQDLRLHAAWEDCQRDYRARNMALQGDYFRRKAGYKTGGRIMRDRFAGKPLAEMSKTEAENYLTTMRARATGQRARRKTKYDTFNEPATDQTDIPF
jgi:hypothetical protein